MLAYEEALARILRAVPAPRPHRARLEDALGLVLARPIAAAYDLPQFDNAAVDGYAVAVAGAGSIVGVSELAVIGVAQAGRPFRGAVRPGQAVRIFTGAPIPEGADAVVMQESVVTGGGHIRLEQRPVDGRHIRRRGEDVRQGRTVITAGTRLRSEEIGLLAALGARSVPVFRRPSVAILTTGSELRAPGRRLKTGQLHDSNRLMLAALAQEAGALPRPLGTAPDEFEAIARGIRRGLEADVLVIAGGMSVGDKDLGRPALRRCGVKRLFWQVNMKPGMPVWFGRRGRTLVFGLPGNPVSAFVTFEEFVTPALARLMGRDWRDPYAHPAQLAADLPVSGSRRTQFVRVAVTGDNGSCRVRPLPGQGSHYLGSLADSDGWLRLSVDAQPLRRGARVLVKERRAT